MPNVYTAEKKSLGDLLRNKLIVPDFQRNYSWDVSLVETFWMDIQNFSDQHSGNAIERQEYFLGPIVLVEVGEGNLKILDGQQRLATSTILLAVVRDALYSRANRDAGMDTQRDFIASRDYYRNQQSAHLTLNRFDRDFFKREIQEEHSETTPELIPEFESHRLIRKAFSFFKEQFSRQLTGMPSDQQVQWILRVREILIKYVSVVVISSDTEENAATIFETLNDRGIGLSAPDLLRNFLLMKAPPDLYEEIMDSWGDVLQIEEHKVPVEVFLRHYWLSNYGDVKARALYREIKANIERQNIASIDISRSLQQEVSVYENLVQVKEVDPQLKEILRAISMVGAKVLYPAAMSIFAVCDLDEKRKLLSDLLSLYIRHTAVGGLENSKLEKFIFELAPKLRRTRNFDLQTIRQEIKEFSPSDTQFKAAFLKAEISKSAVARYILTEIEHRKRQAEGLSVAHGSVTLEHIYPKNPSGRRLENHFSVIDRIGNLTLLVGRVNRQQKNSSFSEKKSRFAESEFLITKQLATLNTWDLPAIEERQQLFADEAVSIWALV